MVCRSPVIASGADDIQIRMWCIVQCACCQHMMPTLHPVSLHQHGHTAEVWSAVSFTLISTQLSFACMPAAICTQFGNLEHILPSLYAGAASITASSTGQFEDQEAVDSHSQAARDEL